jgi:hypothetical protein
MRRRAIVVGGLAMIVGTGFLASGAVGVEPETPTQAPAAAVRTRAFPEAWLGRWKGPARSVSPGRPAMEFTTELVVARTDDPSRFAWTIIYDGAAGKQERKYELIVKDADKGLYEIDEKNGIILPATFIDGALCSRFEVDTAQIATRERLVNPGAPDESIDVEMITATTASPKVSGGGDVPEVRGYAVRSIQSARLKRVPTP